MTSVPQLSRWERKRLMRVVQRSRDAGHVRRAQAMLCLDEGLTVSETAQRIKAARSSVYRWIHWFETGGETALCWSHPGREPWTVCQELVELVQCLVMEHPGRHGYLRSSWSSEMLAKAVTEKLAIDIHASTIRRLLPRLGFGWRRSRPTLCMRDRAKSKKLSAIERAISERCPRTEVFYKARASQWTNRTVERARLLKISARIELAIFFKPIRQQVARLPSTRPKTL